MDSQTIFAALRDALAALYTDEQDARVIVTDAGFDLAKIAFNPRAQTNWFNILSEAIRQNRLERLLQLAREEYPDNPALQAAYAAYERLRAQGQQIESPAPSLGDGPVEQVNTDGGSAIGHDVNLEQGDFVGRDKHVRGIRIDHNVSDSVLVTGDNNQIFVGNEKRRPHAKPPFMVESLPSDYVQRSAEFNQLINYLLAGNEKTVAITATIRGAGGFGKTTLAQAICHDERIRAAFPDGILWTTIGDTQTNVLLGLRKLYQALTHEEAKFVDQHDAITQMREVLAGRRCLLVIDDVWNAAHLQSFLEGGEHCARLVTTRIASVIPKEAEVVALDAMQVSEATELLGWDLPTGATNKDELMKLAQRLGEWPLLLQIVNRRLHDDVKRRGTTLEAAIESANKRLSQRGLTAFDAKKFNIKDSEERKQAVAASIGYGMEGLQTDAAYGHTEVDEVARFLELGIFPEDIEIPVKAVALLWQQTGTLSETDTEELCERLDDLSLILRYDLSKRTILLHDVTRHYLLSRVLPEQLVAWQRALLDGYRSQCANEWWLLPNDGYIYQHILWHLQKAQQQATIEQLLLTYRWLDAKLQATDVVSLLQDFDFHREQQRHAQASLLNHALQMSVGVLVEDKDQLVSQLYGRLNGLGDAWQPLITELANQRRVAWLHPQTPDLLRPGGNLLYTLLGHTAGVDNLLLTADGRLISSCGSSIDRWDPSVKVWDIERGMLLHSLEGHAAGVTKLLLTADGRLISSCGSRNNRDPSVKVWDAERGVLLHSLTGHTDGVNNLLLTAGGRLISSCGRSDSNDHSVKVWDIERGVLLHSLTDHTSGVNNLLLTADGRLISSCNGFGSDNDDHSVKVWDIERGVLLHSLDVNRRAIMYQTASAKVYQRWSAKVYQADGATPAKNCILPGKRNNQEGVCPAGEKQAWTFANWSYNCAAPAVIGR